jgi:hypothetical protein
MTHQNPVVGFLTFGYAKKGYTYKNMIDNQYSQYRETTDIYAFGTEIVIGSLDIFTTMTLVGDDVYGEVQHKYNLPQGTVTVVYVTKNTMSPDGKFFTTELYSSAISSACSGDFEGSVGIANVITDVTNIRKVTMIFYEKWVYPLGA